MQVFHVSPPSSVAPTPTGSAAAPDAADGFSRVLARQQSGQSADAAPPPPSGTTAASSPAEAGGVAPEAGTDDATAADTGADGSAQASGAAAGSPLADMVRELTARSRAVAAGSLERSLAAQAAGRQADPAAPSRVDRSGRPARDGDAAEDLALDPALEEPDPDGAGRPATKRGDAPDDSRFSTEHATALVTPDIDARSSMPARSADASAPGAQDATGIRLSGQTTSGASSALTPAGGPRDPKPGLMTDAKPGRDVGPAAGRSDATAPAGALAADGASASPALAPPGGLMADVRQGRSQGPTAGRSDATAPASALAADGASASPALTPTGAPRDPKPGLMADARPGRDGGLAAGRGDATAPAGASDAGNKTFAAQPADALSAGMLSDPPGDAMAVLNPVSIMSPVVSSMPPGVAAPAPILAGSVPVPVGSPQWAPAFSEQMVQIGTQQGGTLQHAELRLDPPDLGPLRITLSMQGDQATATFISPHASVRTAVEAALPQLMQALADAGISLGNTSVGEQDAREFAAENTRRGDGPDTGDADDGHAVAQTVVQTTRPRGLIDTFA